MADDWVPPSEFEEYRLLRLLGRGGMGSVWLAEDRLLERTVAIKWIAHSEPSVRARERFAREARAAARLQHVNVVTVHRYGEAAGRPYLVSEYIRGESLDKLAKPVPWERALELGISLSRGLAAAHRHGIVHRDIKPANTILALDGEVKLVDFGLAYIEADGASSVSPSTRASGTPAYMAPEVRRGELAGRMSDVYQVGGVLYELVTGDAPLLSSRGNQDATADIASNTRDTQRTGFRDMQAAPRLSDVIARDGAAFAAVVDRCLSADPRDRYASGDELRDALEQLLGTAPEAPAFEGNPYRGLMPFEAEHRAVFFGRGAEARAVIERLRGDAFVLVAGDSGVGKSSLCRAAVLPSIAEGSLGGKGPWTVVQLVPGVRPMTAMLSALATGLALDETTLVELRDQPTMLVREVRRAAAGGLVVFIDQLEELVSIARRDEAEQAAAVLSELAAGVPGVKLLATVRGDFLTRVADLPAFGPEITRSIYLLPPITAAGAREAVTGPARATGVRFESDQLVDELVSFVTDSTRTRSVAALPLLAFTLAQLWEARDRATSMISAESLARIGGARGALATHADGVLEQLLDDQRKAARQILVRLVAPGSTRARRAASDLGRQDRAFVAALDALVRGRLIVARGSGAEATYELAHEGLIDGWPALTALISETEHLRAAHERLAAAVADWERLQRTRDGLWGVRQLAGVAEIPVEELTSAEAAFVSASRRAVTRQRWLRGGLIAMIPVAALSLYLGAKWMTSRDLDARIHGKLGEADRLLVGAQAAAAEHATLRERALAEFDRGDLETAETTWTRALERETESTSAFVKAASVLESAFLLDTGRASVRRRLAEMTYARLEAAERSHRLAERDELAVRLALYDTNGELAARRTAPGELELDIEPTSASVTIVGDGASAGTSLGSSSRLAPGTYLLEARAPGRATVRWPVRVDAGERQRMAFTIPDVAQVPPGFVYVPPGRFAYGSRDAEQIRKFFVTSPMHDIETDGYLIGIHEVTFADWIEFLEEVSDAERELRSPRIATATTFQTEGGIALSRGPDGVYELRYAPAGVEYRARAGEPIVYEERDRRVSQDWRQFPLSGVSAEDAIAYTEWLSRTGRVARARLCDEREWERAARGVDGRTYPHGESLAHDDANFDLTYGQRAGGFGVDIVGAHPTSTSVFGLGDTSGNVWDLTRAATGGGFAMRGGCYYVNSKVARLANREEIPGTFRHHHIGFRVCADAPTTTP